jgi:hypothetical protein
MGLLMPRIEPVLVGSFAHAAKAMDDASAKIVNADGLFFGFFCMATLSLSNLKRCIKKI